MTWLLMVLALVAAVAGEWHGRHVAYARDQVAMRGLVAQMEDLAGRWSARRVAREVLRQARVPRRRPVIGPDVPLEEIEETPEDLAYRAELCGCDECVEITAAVAATTAPDTAAELTP